MWAWHPFFNSSFRAYDNDNTGLHKGVGSKQREMIHVFFVTFWVLAGSCGLGKLFFQ